jgi:hypothetical protein
MHHFPVSKIIIVTFFGKKKSLGGIEILVSVVPMYPFPKVDKALSLKSVTRLSCRDQLLSRSVCVSIFRVCCCCRGKSERIYDGREKAVEGTAVVNAQKRA